MCWGAGETNIWDGHWPSSLCKPQTLWQQENRSGSDQGLCNPDPGRTSAGGGSGDLGSETESTSEVRLDTHVYCTTLVSILDFKASKIHFLVQSPPRAGMGRPGSQLQCPAGRGCSTAGSLAALERCGRGGGGLLSNLLQCPTVKCVTREVPKGAPGGQPSPNVAEEQRLEQEEASRAVRTLIRRLATPNTRERDGGFSF